MGTRIEIDQEALCGFCGKKGGPPPSQPCEGRWCEETEEEYLDSLGITVVTGCDKKSFQKITIGTIIFELTDGITPGIVNLEVVKISTDGNGLSINVKSGYINVMAGETDRSFTDNFFLKEEDAKAALVELCTKRVTTLALIMGKAS